VGGEWLVLEPRQSVSLLTEIDDLYVFVYIIGLERLVSLLCRGGKTS
jgi:hypothetical protein